MGVSTNLGTKVNRRKRAIRTDPNVVKNVGPKGSGKGDWVVVKVGDTREEMKEITDCKFFRRYPEFLTAVVDNLVLVRVAVDGISTGRSGKEIRE